MDTLPVELQGLLGLCRAYFIAIIYDEHGKPFQGAFDGIHAHQDVLNAFLKIPIFTAFEISPETYQKILDLPAKEVLELQTYLLTKGLFNQYPYTISSTNQAEASVSLPHFSIKLPITFASLYPLANNRMLCIIALDTYLSRFVYLDNSWTVLVDENGRIFGYSDLFAKALQLQDKQALLAQNLSDVLDIRETTSQTPSDISWQTDRTWATHDLQKSWSIRDEYSNDNSETSYPNSFCRINTHDKTLYWLFSELVFTDTEHFSFEVSYSAKGHKIPNLIFRGNDSDTLLSPDWCGYSFTNLPNESKIRLKRGSREVHRFAFTNLADLSLIHISEPTRPY